MNFIRKYKLSYALVNFFNKKSLIHNLPHYKRFGLKKKYYSPISSEDFKGIESPKNYLDASNSKVELPEKKGFQELPENIQKGIINWSDQGYAIIENLFSSEEIDAINLEIENLIENRKVKFKYGNKIMFAIHKSQLLKRTGKNETLQKVLNLLLGKEALLFQSINFITGSQQRTHSDSVHMTTFPYGNLIAVWVALEDIKAESGPLHYYPGSHKLPYIMNRDYDNVGTKFKLGNKNYGAYEDRIAKLINDEGLKKEVFLPKKGDVLIWHANLLHGGEAVTNDKQTRKSMVFHYYTDDAICFHEITQRPTLKK